MTMERSITAFSFALLASLASALLLVVQAQPGFINIDCGAPNEYTDENTNITYEMDDKFIAFGKKTPISGMHIGRYDKVILNTLRFFPDGMRNCYTMRPEQGKNRTYIMKASFYYGNYDGKNQAPTFELHIDVHYFARVNADYYVTTEIIYESRTDVIQLCLVNIGQGVPFIFALELRALDDDMYQSETGLLRPMTRLNVGGSSTANDIRYPNDVYDRGFTPWTFDKWVTLNTTDVIDISSNNNAYKIAGDVLRTAQRSMNSSSPLYLEWIIDVWPTTDAQSLQPQSPRNWIVCSHFMEIERLKSGQQREFTISMNGNQFVETVSLEYLKPVAVLSTPIEKSIMTVSINSTNKSGYPPILNAVEFFLVLDRLIVPTSQNDVQAINDIKERYSIKRESWQGDPCMPTTYVWDGLNCSSGNPPRIISMKLDSSNLIGPIVSSLANLSMMEYLDLSNNQLTGVIPETLAELPNLRFLNLSGNNLIGSVPEALKKRVDDNVLSISLTGNANLCLADPCPHQKKENNILVVVVTSVASFFVLLFCVVAIIWLIKRKRHVTLAEWLRHVPAKYMGFLYRKKQKTEPSERALILKNRPFTYEEISRITKNLRQEIGKGGFGKVYRGTLDNGTRVAVKMLFQSPNQGLTEFVAEARLLTIVHHRNLVSLLGYCDDREHMALVFEYMANGNLEQHLKGDHPKVLTWSERLQIAVDAAQGLDYLHNGCKPPIIHRDLKTPNILLNEDFRAKIADFGLSRAFKSENDTHVKTRVAGTFGYIAPEFQNSGNCSKKSDVYSFGIILLELITGQPVLIRSLDGSVANILQWFTPIFESGCIETIMDPRLQGAFDINSAWKVAEIAMSCTQSMDERPDINHVLAGLKELVSNSSGGPEMTPPVNSCGNVTMLTMPR